MTDPKTEALQIARDALDEIALAGMSGTGEESPEAMNAWHARRAREFIGIAARALDPIRAALAATSAPAEPGSDVMDWKTAAAWLHAAYDRPPLTPESRSMLAAVDALATSAPADQLDTLVVGLTFDDDSREQIKVHGEPRMLRRLEAYLRLKRPTELSACSGDPASCPENEGFGCCALATSAPAEPSAIDALPCGSCDVGTYDHTAATGAVAHSIMRGGPLPNCKLHDRVCVGAQDFSEAVAATELRAAAEQAIATSAPSEPAPRGWKLVPGVLTDDMLHETWRGLAGASDHATIREAYRRMLAAAPQPAPAVPAAAEPVGWRRWAIAHGHPNGGFWTFYDERKWPDCEPLYTASSAAQLVGVRSTSRMLPTYFVQHPDGSYTPADPQPEPMVMFTDPPVVGYTPPGPLQWEEDDAPTIHAPVVGGALKIQAPKVQSETHRDAAEDARKAMEVAAWALRHPNDEWKGDAERKALDALRPILAQPEGVRICPEKDAECGTHLCATCPKAQPEACPHCDNTGDVHRADGEWLGECKACVAQPEAPAEPKCGGREYCARMPFCGCGGPDPLAERDPTKGAKEQGLFNKFDVRRTDGSDAPGGKHHGCEYFVLDTTHDAFAKAALTAYAEACRTAYPALFADLWSRYDLPLSATPPAEVEERRGLSDALQCLRDLVYLKDMKERLEKLREMGHGTDWDYYHKNKPATWERARAILAKSKEKAS